MISPSQRADLHIHTYYSDGRPSPKEVVEQATRLGLHTIAITDHDNTRGSREAIALARQNHIDLVPGIELTTCWTGCPTILEGADVDLLGYFMDLDNAEFRAIEEASLADIYARVEDCCQRLTASGYPVTLADVFSENPFYAGLLELVQFFVHQNYFSDFDSANLLMLEHWQAVRPGKLLIEDAIGAIHHAGGKAVLAHPTMVTTTSGWLQADEVSRLVEMGLDGIEIYHRRLDQKARAHFLKLADQFRLAISGGSDEHGWPDGLSYLGGEPVDRMMVDALKGDPGR